MRTALPAFVNDADHAATVKNEVAIIAIGERPTVLTNYTVQPGRAAKRASTASGRTQGSGAYLLDGIIEVVPGLQEARRAAAGDRRHPDRRARS